MLTTASSSTRYLTRLDLSSSEFQRIYPRGNLGIPLATEYDDTGAAFTLSSGDWPNDKGLLTATLTMPKITGYNGYPTWVLLSEWKSGDEPSQDSSFLFPDLTTSLENSGWLRVNASHLVTYNFNPGKTLTATIRAFFFDPYFVPLLSGGSIAYYEETHTFTF